MVYTTSSSLIKIFRAATQHIQTLCCPKWNEKQTTGKKKFTQLDTSNHDELMFLNQLVRSLEITRSGSRINVVQLLLHS